MKARDWDERYAAVDLVWSAGPNRWVEQVAADLPPGRALDVAAGEGRNAIWLASRGWSVVAADFSEVAIERARRLALDQLGADAGRFTGVVGDALAPAPEGGPYDLVLFSYLQLPANERRRAWSRGIEAAAPGGRVVVIGHAARNLGEGWGGPQDLAVLYDADDVVGEVADQPVEVESAEIMVRPVETEDGIHEALDTVVVLRRV
ncbi:MAG: class I SAM-dependent methyltransferase [Intrasporangium sp.]|uniref:class I SAM-dependent methyltransferase n=1 Tax=Intrasporangium sp. TaxID=1925024 RepID=UPI002647084E|nr:class I SAM-dependent methyltransferase [Intrasporangium sp.]MDN5796231.1 class I SAM-dependent methyltransferase [Intrasporangium sp.]